MRLVVSLPALTCLALALTPNLALAQNQGRESLSTQPTSSNAARDASRPVASEALDHYDAGRYAEAIIRFQQADSIYPAPQYRVYIARSYAKLGRLLLAARTYEAVLGMASPADATAAFEDAQQTAREEGAELRKRIPTLSIVVRGPSASEAHVTVDDELVTLDGASPIPADPGMHTVVVQARGFEAVSQTIELSEGHTSSLNLVLARSVPPRVITAAAPPAATTAPTTSTPFAMDRPMGDAPTHAQTSNHRGQLGLTLRGDLDAFNPGVLFAPGLSYGLFEHLELGVSALLGGSRGVEPNMTLYLFNGAWKPFVQAAAPVFVTNPVRTGVRGAVGLQWDPDAALGVFAEVGGAYFHGIPEGYDHLLLLPSAGLQGRL